MSWKAQLDRVSFSGASTRRGKLTKNWHVPRALIAWKDREGGPKSPWGLKLRNSTTGTMQKSANTSEQ